MRYIALNVITTAFSGNCRKHLFSVCPFASFSLVSTESNVIIGSIITLLDNILLTSCFHCFGTSYKRTLRRSHCIPGTCRVPFSLLKDCLMSTLISYFNSIIIGLRYNILNLNACFLKQFPNLFEMRIICHHSNNPLQ